MNRRDVLAGAVASLVLGACTRRRRRVVPSPTATRSPTPVPDGDLLAAWYAAEQRLVRLSGTVPGAASVRADHLIRSRAILDRLHVLGLGPPTVTLPPAVPHAKAALATAEGAAARTYVAALPAVVDPAVAVLGAELAAGARAAAVALR